MMHNEMSKLTSVKSRLIDIFESEICTNLSHADEKELSAVSDMIKDISECEKNCMETMYYEEIIKAMTEGESEKYMSDGIFGYSGSGRGASGRSGGSSGSSGSSRGGRSGYSVRRPHYSMGYTEMNENPGEEDLDEAMDILKEMWDRSPVSLKKRMKSELKGLVDGLNVP